jgi:osmotically-inducible protein OsmY
MQPAAEGSNLRQVVLNEIRQKPEMSETDVSVAADQGIVTLTGTVKTRAERIAVETVAKQVRGVRAVANDLAVKPSLDRESTEIARDVLKGLRSHIFLAAEDIRVVVRDGCVTLEGKVHSELQRMLAEAEVKRLRSIAGISNQLKVESEAFTEEAKCAIETGARTEPEAAALSNNEVWVETGEGEAG